MDTSLDVDTNPNFHVNADSDPYPDWHQCFIFLISVKGAILLSIFNGIFKISGKKYSCKLFHMTGIDTDPDPAK